MTTPQTRQQHEAALLALREALTEALRRGAPMAAYILDVTQGRKPTSDRFAVTADWFYSEAQHQQVLSATDSAATEIVERLRAEAVEPWREVVAAVEAEIDETRGDVTATHALRLVTILSFALKGEWDNARALLSPPDREAGR